MCSEHVFVIAALRWFSNDVLVSPLLVDRVQDCDFDANFLNKFELPRLLSSPASLSAASSSAPSPPSPFGPSVSSAASALDAVLKTRRESASQIDEFFEEAVDGACSANGGNYVQRFLMGACSSAASLAAAGVGVGLENLREWDDIKTSLTHIDPDNADMLIKIEPSDGSSSYQHQPHHQPHHHAASYPQAHHTTGAAVLPPTPPSSDPGSPDVRQKTPATAGAVAGAAVVAVDPLKTNRKTPPPPYPSSSAPAPRSKIGAGADQCDAVKTSSNPPGENVHLHLHTPFFTLQHENELLT